MSEIQIMACCYSEKEDVSIGFGTSFDSDSELLDELDTEWIDVGMSESFWENHFEFEPGIEKAKKLADCNSELSFAQALQLI